MCINSAVRRCCYDIRIPGCKRAVNDICAVAFQDQVGRLEPLVALVELHDGRNPAVADNRDSAAPVAHRHSPQPVEDLEVYLLQRLVGHHIHAHAVIELRIQRLAARTEVKLPDRLSRISATQHLKPPTLTHSAAIN